jgi:PhzF family phenazine biosynthesis protein
MKKFRFKKIDAFATQKSRGNPAGYIWLDSEADISAFEMLQIAKELKGFVNEVGYIHRKSDNLFNLKFYSSEGEVDFCGHATIAIMYDLIKNSEGLRQRNVLKIQTNRGELEVENRIEREDAVFIMSPVPEVIKEIPGINKISAGLKIQISEIDRSLPISVINAGLSTLIIPIKSLKSILSILPDLKELKEFCIHSGIDIIEVFTKDVVHKNNDYRTRVFAPKYGYLEDPATGSGNSAFGYYLLGNNMWDHETITIEQNGTIDNYNIVKLKKKQDDNRIERVLFGGGAITRINGVYILWC